MLTNKDKCTYIVLLCGGVWFFCVQFFTAYHYQQILNDKQASFIEEEGHKRSRQLAYIRECKDLNNLMSYFYEALILDCKEKLDMYEETHASILKNYLQQQTVLMSEMGYHPLCQRHCQSLETKLKNCNSTVKSATSKFRFYFQKFKLATLLLRRSHLDFRSTHEKMLQYVNSSSWLYVAGVLMVVVIMVLVLMNCVQKVSPATLHDKTQTQLGLLVAQLRQIDHSIKEVLEGLEQKCTSLQSNVDNLGGELRLSQQRLETKEQECGSLTRSCEAFRIEIQTLKEKLNVKDREVADMKHRISHNMAELCNNDILLRKSKDENERLQEELIETKVKVQERSLKIERLEKEKSGLLSECNEAYVKIMVLEKSTRPDWEQVSKLTVDSDPECEVCEEPELLKSKSLKRLSGQSQETKAQHQEKTKDVGPTYL